MMFRGIGGDDQPDHECDGLVVDRIKIQPLAQTKYRSQRLTDAIEPPVGQGYSVADARTAQPLTLIEYLENGMPIQRCLVSRQQRRKFLQHSFLAGSRYVEQYSVGAQKAIECTGT